MKSHFNRDLFFSTIYQFCEGKIELRALPSRHQKFFEINDLVGVAGFCNSHIKKDLYFGVATRDGDGGAAKNITEIPAVWCDVDFKDIPQEKITKNLSNFPFKPSLVVRSGGGIHLYWLLSEPLPIAEKDEIEDVNRRIATHLGGDLNACDVARILRIPDTFNYKYDPPRQIIVSKQNNFNYHLGDFFEILPEIPQPTPQHSKTIDWLTEAMKGCPEANPGRNALGTKIAGYWINKLNAGDVLAILRPWNENNIPPLPDNTLKAIVNSVSRYKDSEDKQKIDISNVYDYSRMLESYRDYVQQQQKNRFITGIRPIDTRIRGVAAGEVLTIIARAGAFKTSLLQNLLKNYTKNSAWAAVFFSLEMPIPNVTERFISMILGIEGYEIETAFKNNQTTHIEAQFQANIKNIYTVPVPVSLKDIPSYVDLIKQHFNKKIGVIGIDYLGLIDGPGTSTYEIVSKLAKGVKKLAKLLDIPVVLLCQTSRKGGSGNKEITLDMARDSGTIEEAADFILGLWQVESETKVIVGDTEPQHDLICKILKNRKGSKNSRWILDLDPKTFRIGSDAEKYEPKQKKSGI